MRLLSVFLLLFLVKIGHGDKIDRVIFSLTTQSKRIQHIEHVLKHIVEQELDEGVEYFVYLNVPPEIETLPSYMNETERFRVHRMERDFGPASKILGTLLHERSRSTLIVYGDDDIVLPSNIVSMHYNAHRSYDDNSQGDVAFGTRKIRIGADFGMDPAMDILEATGTISIRADVLHRVPSVFQMIEVDACRLSDDFWIFHHLRLANVEQRTLPCTYDFHRNRWPSTICGSPFHVDPRISDISALSSVVVDVSGNMIPGQQGDWRVQLQRYAMCDRMIRSGELVLES